MVEFGTSSAFGGWVYRVRVRVLGYGFGVGADCRKVKSRDCALASDFHLVPIPNHPKSRRVKILGKNKYDSCYG